MQRPLLAVIMGNIGAGKSTATELFSKRIGGTPVWEPVAANPYLDLFYRDMERYAFPLQVYMLSHRLQAAVEAKGCPGIIWQDRCVREDRDIFARNLHQSNLISEDDWRTYNHIYDTMTPHFMEPDVFVYLRARVDTLQKRIAKRGRSCELGITDEYLHALNRNYNDLAESIYAERRSLLLVVDMDMTDLTIERQAEPVLARVREAVGARLLTHKLMEATR